MTPETLIEREIGAVLGASAEDREARMKEAVENIMDIVLEPTKEETCPKH